MLADVVEQILRPLPEVEIVGFAAQGQNSLAAAGRAGADMLIVNEPTCRLVDMLAYPGISILAISNDGAAADLLWLEQSRLALDDRFFQNVSTRLRDRARTWH